MIRSKLMLGAAIVATLFTAGCQEDPEAAANKLFVEASTALAQADALTGTSLEDLTKRRDLLASAVSNLDTIVGSYPSASLAVDLASAGSAKGIVVAVVKLKLDEVNGDLACAEKPLDGKCRVDSLLENALSRNLDSEKRALFGLLAASNGRWDDAFEIAQAVKDDRRLDVALASIIVFSILLDEPSVTQRAIELVPERDKDDIAGFLMDFNDQLEKIDWKVTKALAPAFTVQAVPELSTQSAEQVSDLVSAQLVNLGTQLKGGDMDGVRTSVSNAFVIFDSVLSAGNEDQVFAAFRKMQGDLEAVFSAFR